jgi:hypothetical protein
LLGELLASLSSAAADRIRNIVICALHGRRFRARGFVLSDFFGAASGIRTRPTLRRFSPKMLSLRVRMAMGIIAECLVIVCP